ncbi:MAG: 50S ribosomal protein L25 [bacterium]|nr:50S ribosomal protein L25 [bacterium]
MQELTATTREVRGKQVATLRRQGILPAVLYGEGVASRSISVPFDAFLRAYKAAGESAIVKLTVDREPYNVLIHEVAHDPLRGHPVHADFYAVRMDRKLRTMVSLVFLGESPAVKNLGGILVKVVQELEVEALPADLPHELVADVGMLKELEERILVRNIKLPTGVSILADADEVVAIVEPPRSEEEIAALHVAPAPAAELVEVKTEGELKRAEREKAAPVEEEKK